MTDQATREAMRRRNPRTADRGREPMTLSRCTPPPIFTGRVDGDHAAESVTLAIRDISLYVDDGPRSLSVCEEYTLRMLSSAVGQQSNIPITRILRSAPGENKAVFGYQGRTPFNDGDRMLIKYAADPWGDEPILKPRYWPLDDDGNIIGIHHD